VSPGEERLVYYIGYALQRRQLFARPRHKLHLYEPLLAPPVVLARLGAVQHGHDGIRICDVIGGLDEVPARAQERGRRTAAQRAERQGALTNRPQDALR